MSDAAPESTDGLAGELLAARNHETLRSLLNNNTGESPNCDFKSQWPGHAKLARHVLGFANSQGGCIVIGVEEDGEGKLKRPGISPFTDEADIQNGLDRFLPNQLLASIRVGNFTFPFDDTEDDLAGKSFQVMFIPDQPRYLPYLALVDGDGLNRCRIYVRRGTKSQEANYDEIQDVINRRIESGHSTRSELDLAAHFDHLGVLYQVLRIHTVQEVQDSFEPFTTYLTAHVTPAESRSAFIQRMIEEKKRRIERELDLQ